MLDISWVVLVDVNNPTEFFENAEFVIGIPLVALGILGALVALLPIEIPRLGTVASPSAVESGEAGGAEVEEALAPGAEEHPTPRVYITVGLILGVITAIEVAIFYVDMIEGAFIGILLALSLMKFVMVALWFMHLRFDSRLFSTLFTGGLLLIIALAFVLVTTLGASLV